MADIQIVSNIMNLLGRQPITSIQDDEWGPIIDARVDQTYEVIIEAFGWQSAIRHFELTQSTTNDNPDWKRCYDLPTDLVKLLDVRTSFFDSEESRNRTGEFVIYEDYSVEGMSLYSNRENLIVRYVTKDIALNLQSKNFQEALGYFVAADLAPVLLENPNMAELYTQKYNFFLAEARKVDFASLGRPTRWRVRRRSV